jgi:hypothetical protein
MKLYLSGPMSGIEHFNYPAFNGAAHLLREAGHDVFNPAETDGGDTSKPYAYYMRIDIPAVMEAEAVCVLPGWEHSRGARLEVDIARALDLPIFRHDVDVGFIVLLPAEKEA